MLEGIYLFDVLIPLLGVFGFILLFVSIIDLDSEMISGKIKYGGLFITVILIFIFMLGYNTWFDNTDDIERESYILYPFDDGNYLIYNIYEGIYYYKRDDGCGNLIIEKHNLNDYCGNYHRDINIMYDNMDTSIVSYKHKVIFRDSIFEDRKKDKNYIEFNIPSGTYKTIDGVDIHE